MPTIFFSSNKRKSEYLNTVLEQSLQLTRRHQKEYAHMNKTCTAIENITNDALSRIMKIQTLNSYSLKIKKTLHTWGIFNSRYLMFTQRKDRREDIRTYSSVRDSDVKSSTSYAPSSRQNAQRTGSSIFKQSQKCYHTLLHRVTTCTSSARDHIFSQ